MVVVLGGVGSLAGTILGSVGLGIANKILGARSRALYWVRFWFWFLSLWSSSGNHRACLLKKDARLRFSWGGWCVKG